MKRKMYALNVKSVEKIKVLNALKKIKQTKMSVKSIMATHQLIHICHLAHQAANARINEMAYEMGLQFNTQVWVAGSRTVHTGSTNSLRLKARQGLGWSIFL